MTRNSRHATKRLKRTFQNGLLLLLFLQSANSLFAQPEPIIRIDHWTGTTTDAVPFDRPFVLVLPVDSTLKMEQITEIALQKSGVKNGQPFLDTNKLADYGAPQIKSLGGHLIDSGKFKYLMLRIPARLPSNTRFSVILYVTSTVYFQQLEKINVDLYHRKIAKARQEYHDLASNIYLKNSNNGVQIEWPPFDPGDTDPIYNPAPGNLPYRRYFEDSLRSLYDKILTDDGVIAGNLQQLADLLHNAGFSIPNLFAGDFKKDYATGRVLINSPQFLTPLQNLLNLDDAIPYFAAGKLDPQKYEPYDTVKDNESDLRIANLGKLKQSLDTISYNFHETPFATTIDDATRHNLNIIIQRTLPAIRDRIDSLKTFVTTINQRMNRDSAIFGGQLSLAASAPVGQDIKTTSGNYIIADLGLASALTFVNGKPGYEIRPYLGINISFTPIDKSVPFDSVQHKKLLHRLSAVLGLTTAAQTRQGTGDLINTMSLVSGVAYRLTRSFRVTVGVLVYKRNSANPVLPQQVTVGPMVAASLDLDVATWFSDLKKLVF